MIDREKVIKTLEGIGIALGYHKDAQAVRDAIALLKEQEPRVMTRKEIENSGGTEFYSEHKDEEYMYLDHTEGPAYIMGNMERLPLNRLRWGDYGRTWRCWTSRPTDKERRDTKWEEHNG